MNRVNVFIYTAFVQHRPEIVFEISMFNFGCKLHGTSYRVVTDCGHTDVPSWFRIEWPTTGPRFRKVFQQN